MARTPLTRISSPSLGSLSFFPLAAVVALTLGCSGGSGTDTPATTDTGSTGESGDDTGSSDDTGSGGGDTATGDTGTTGDSTGKDTTPPGDAPPAGGIKTVFLILMENENWSSIKGSASAPYINKTLLVDGAHAENYQNIIHPSEPNYVWLEAGDNLGITNDSDPSANHQATTDHLVTHLKAKGVSWHSWQEDISGTVCPLKGVAKYAPKHNPMIFFDDVTNTNDPAFKYCIDNNRPYGEFAAALTASTVARYNFITPNLCNDMHDCGIAAGDTWLSKEIPKIQASKAYTDGGVIFVLWDETGGSTTLGMIALGTNVKKGYSSSVKFTHSSTLRSIQDIFGITPYIRDAAKATNLSDLFTSFP